MKNIKVIYRGNKSPSGKKNETEYMISSERLKQLEASGMFDIEVLEKPEPKPKAEPKKKTSYKKGGKE